MRIRIQENFLNADPDPQHCYYLLLLLVNRGSSIIAIQVAEILAGPLGDDHSDDEDFEEDANGNSDEEEEEESSDDDDNIFDNNLAIGFDPLCVIQ